MFRNLLRLSRPLHLLLTALTYFLGASIANYLGKPFRADSFWLGLIAALFAQANMNLLAEVFRPSNEAIIDGETRKQRLTFRNNALYISIASLTANAVIAFILYNNHHLSVSAFFHYYSRICHSSISIYQSRVWGISTRRAYGLYHSLHCLYSSI